MSGFFSSVFNPDISVTDGSDTQEQASSGSEGYAEEGESSSSEASGSSSENSLDADAALDLGVDVTISNQVEMTYVDEDGGVSTYSRTDELSLDVDAGAAVDTLLTTSGSETSEDFAG